MGRATQHRPVHAMLHRVPVIALHVVGMNVGAGEKCEFARVAHGDGVDPVILPTLGDADADEERMGHSSVGVGCKVADGGLGEAGIIGGGKDE